MAGSTFSAESLKGRRVFALLEMDLASAGLIRMSTEPVSIAGTGGGDFMGGLDGVDFSDEIDLFGISETNRSLSVSAVLPVNVAELVSKGFDLTTTKAEVSLWVEGTDYTDRRILISDAVLIDPEYGESTEPLSFSLRSNFFDETATIPEPSATVTAETWPDSPQNARGRSYPWIFGLPGKKDASSYDTWGSEALRVDTTGTDKFLIAGHEITDGTTVEIAAKSNIGGGTSGLVPVHMNDGLGRRVAVVSVNASTLSSEDPDDEEYFIMWDSGGGRPNRRNTGPMRGAGDVLDFFLRYAPSIKIDAGRMAAARSALNTIAIDCTIDEPIEVWRWLRNNLLKYLPASMASSGAGMFPVVWDRALSADQAVANIDADRDEWERTSSVELEFLDREARNDFKMTYAKNIYTGTIQNVATIDGGSKIGSTSYARASFKRYGRKQKVDESIVFYKAEAAFQVLAWWSRIYGFPIRKVEYTAPIDFGWLMAGAVIVFTDARIHVQDQIAIVQAIEWAEDRIVGIRLVWLEDLPRDSRAI